MPPFTVSNQYRQQYLQRMELAMNYIEQNIALPLDLETVARAANFSPYHFHRIFKALVGENPQDYINRMRAERAANMLMKNPAWSMTEIAFACGYTSASAFSRSFKRYFGVSASEYARRRTQDAPALPPPSAIEEESGAFCTPEVYVRKAGPLHLAYFASRKGYDPESTKAVWVRLFHWANARQLIQLDTQLIGISFDDPEITPLRKCRYFACMTMPPELTADQAVNFFDFPEHLCAAARIVCQGVSQIQQAYRWIYRIWLPDSGFFMANLPPYDVILDAPDVHPGGNYVFDLCVPVTLM